MSHVVVEQEIGGRTFRLETGKWAKQADAAVFATYADTSVLAAVVRGDPREGIDFFPLQVDYRERTAAAGKFPGGFRKREGAPNSKEILTMRLIDRPLRPLFPKGLLDEVQIQCWVESADGQNDSDVLAGTAAAAAVALSSIPFDRHVATVRVGRVEGQFVINPTAAELDYTDLELVLSGHRDGVNMIEVGAQEVDEQSILDAIAFGHENIFTLLNMIDELVAKAGKEKKAKLHVPDEALLNDMRSALSDRLEQAKRTEGKLAREEAVINLRDEYIDQAAPQPGDDADVSYTKYLAIQEKRGWIKQAFEIIEEEVSRKMILQGPRTDGRSNDQVRPIDVEIAPLARTHGSAVFTRGETQSLASCTLGVGRDEQIVDGLGDEYSQKFMLHYNFPPFCVGEARRISGPSRREIGHGALAERSLAGITPSPEEFPYTIRLLSEILESNGSSSMASVCAGCLALMDAGVPIHNTCAGISIGLVQEGDRLELLTDIMGEEDHFGDMDFKVAGTRKGITGIQLDLKTAGIDRELIGKVLERAREGRLHIINRMEEAIAAPRDEISVYAPRLLTIKIDPDKIGRLIGPGGKNVRQLQEDTGARIEIEDDGTVLISAAGGGKAEAARDEIEKLCEEIKVDKIYAGKVVSIRDFGAFVELTPGQDGLLHISELSNGYVERVEDIVKLGQEIRVKVISKDDQGRVKLSLRAAEGDEAADAEAAEPAGRS